MAKYVTIQPFSSIISKNVKQIIFTDFDIWHWNIGKVLYLLCQDQQLEMLISKKRSELAQKCKKQLLSILIFAIKWHHCESCALWPWPTFSR